jgi:hypothetical protein
MPRKLPTANNILIQLKTSRLRRGRVVCYVCQPRYNYVNRNTRFTVAIPATSHYEPNALNIANLRGAVVYDPPRDQVLRDLIAAVEQIRGDLHRDVPVAYHGPESEGIPSEWHRGNDGVLMSFREVLAGAADLPF